jgi:ribonuclease P protein component
MPVYRSLTNSSQFRKVLSTGRRARRNGVVIVCTRNGREGAPRIGLVAKASRGRAVGRNRARRRLRAAVTSAAPGGSFDIVITAGTEVEELEFQELVEMLREAMHEVGVTCA